MVLSGLRVRDPSALAGEHPLAHSRVRPDVSQDYLARVGRAGDVLNAGPDVYRPVTCQVNPTVTPEPPDMVFEQPGRRFGGAGVVAEIACLPVDGYVVAGAEAPRDTHAPGEVAAQHPVEAACSDGHRTGERPAVRVDPGQAPPVYLGAPHDALRAELYAGFKSAVEERVAEPPAVDDEEWLWRSLDRRGGVRTHDAETCDLRRAVARDSLLYTGCLERVGLHELARLAEELLLAPAVKQQDRVPRPRDPRARKSAGEARPDDDHVEMPVHFNPASRLYARASQGPG